MADLKKLVNEGIYDKKTNSILQVRIISHLGDNLGQNEVKYDSLFVLCEI